MKKYHIQFGDEIAPGKRLVVRRKGEELTAGIVSQLKDGEPIQSGGELVYVDNADSDGWHPTTVLYRHGPAQVATPAYREGYDRIFGGRQKAAEA